jgi:TolB-like protein/tetratricopeptide (TPR) repeat protein/predicted Ser/Thr protein kinase
MEIDNLSPYSKPEGNMAIKCPKCRHENPEEAVYCSKCASPLKTAEGVSVTKTLITTKENLKKGTTLAGRYTIIEELGRGGMGVVYKAEDTKLKRTVALKFLPPELTHVPEVHERFTREAQAAAALDHPNICTVYEFDRADETSFISMAYIEGQSLRKKLESGPLEPDEALRIATQVAEGLQEAHQKGIVHRDIKSANIMVTNRAQAKIMDFGLARMTGTTLLTQEGSAMGTIAYMSPEQARGEEVDHRTDIWSLGVVMYEMLTGKLPFKGEHEQAIVYAIRKDKPEPITDINPDIPVSIEQVVSKALEKDPHTRYQQPEELLDDLKSISAGIIPEEIKARLRKAKLRKRKRMMLYAGATGLVIILAVLGFILLKGPPETIDSIAVLPLKNLTGAAEKEYFVDGVTDELIGHLGQISGLRRVISRTSVMQYKDTDKTLPDIARELNVDALVEGSVYQIGENVSIKLQLFDALPEERSLWTERYDRPATDVLVMYGEVARTIADQIQVKLTADETSRFAGARQVNPKAYEACLLGWSHWSKFSPADLETAEQYFESALEKDPDYALAHAGMFLALVTRAQIGLVPPGEVLPEAKPYLLKALELDDTLAEAHFAMACLKTWLEWDWEGGEASFLRLIELNPNYAMARVYYSTLLCYLDRSEEAAAQGAFALELDPLNSAIMSNYANTMLLLRRYDEAIAQCRNALRTSPNNPQSHAILWEVFHSKRQYDEALAEAKAFYAALELTPVVEAMSSGYETGGYQGAMHAAAETLAAISQQVYVGPCFIAFPYAAAGETEKALECLEKGFEIRDPNMPYMEEPIFADLLGDEPRYQELLRKMNLPVGIQ